MSWETQEVMQEPATNLADKDHVSFSTASDISGAAFCWLEES